jgi:hypothetical protein
MEETNFSGVQFDMMLISLELNSTIAQISYLQVHK